MNFHSLISATTQNRKVLKKILDMHSLEQINKIPAGFNNNLIWNAAHTISIQQVIVYRLAGLPTPLDKEIVKAYTIDTKPEGDVDETFVELIKSQLKSTIEVLVEDIEADKFTTFKPMVTSTGYEINDLMSALTFNLYHEGLHLGYIMNIKRFLK